jgi:hypothetical protein
LEEFFAELLRKERHERTGIKYSYSGKGYVPWRVDGGFGMLYIEVLEAKYCPSEIRVPIDNMIELEITTQKKYVEK